MALTKEFIDYLKYFFEINKHIDKGHGLCHALKVAKHAERMIKITPSFEKKLKEEYSSLFPEYIIIAALLHDVDDRKFFPLNKNYENANGIITAVFTGIRHVNNLQNARHLILDMIKLVSFSENKTYVLCKKSTTPAMLIPRYADRLEALGKIGIKRAYIYGKHVGRKLILPSTPLGIDPLLYATTERRDRYYKTKTSESFIDHFYDKILHLRNVDIENKYLREKMAKKHAYTIRFLRDVYIFCGRDEQMIDEYIQNSIFNT